MNIFTAIMKAADHIEKNPQAWDFWNLNVPECGTSGCALGFVGMFLGVPQGVYIEEVAIKLGCGNSAEFYQRMNLLGDPSWDCSASRAAHALRLYAHKYHSQPERGIPPEVLAIFNEQQEQTA